MSRRLVVDVYFDFVCPWCLIGKRQLATALAQLRATDPDVNVLLRWRGVQLLPQVPAGGLPFDEFYLRRLGSAAAVRERQAMVLRAAGAAGAEVDFASIRVMPNTADAHRMFEAACATASPDQADALLERLFAAYFSGGADFGDGAWLLAEAAACGVAGKAASAMQQALLGASHPYVPQSPPGVEATGGVPCFVIDGAMSVSGAQSPRILLSAMRQALAANPA
jgi:predicted DsbA family dithiol-disulfide isomerase